MADLDPAQVVELKALALQQPMNDVIERGDSAIQQLYRDATVFITGGCGFIGKQLIEKLFRACAIKKMFVLVRPKNGRSIQQRLELTLSNPVFDTLRKKQPQFAERIVPVEGDVVELGLNLSEADWTLLTQEVNIIFHAAATIRFDEPLRRATITNVRGTREALRLATQCQRLIKYVHISTAFTHATRDRINKEVLDDFYPSPVPPHTMISLAEELDEKRLDSITMNLIEGWPNTYTFTKAIAEELVRTTAGEQGLPVCVVRPPIVISSYCEPSPGWLDQSSIIGPSGIYLAAGLGILNVVYADGSNHLSMAPVDVVNNTIIAAVWDSTQRQTSKEQDIPIYTITRKEIFQWSYLTTTMRYKCAHLRTPNTVWYNGSFETKHKSLYIVLAIFLHYVPAILLDAICAVLRKKPKEITSFVGVYRTLDKLSNVYDYFLKNEWNFHKGNVQDMVKRMSSADRAIFNCDMEVIDVEEYIKVWGIGLRKFILKDGLRNTAQGVRKQKIFRVLNFIVCVLYIYIWWWIISSVFNVITYICYSK